MAQIGISEFTFGYAFLFEQTHANWAGSPRRQCSRASSRSRMLVGTRTFRLPARTFITNYLSRSNASYIADGTYATPYYRISLHRRNGSQQHRRLRQLSLAKPHTYYVAQEFNSIDHFNSRFLARQVTADCRIIPVNACEDVTNNEQHCITFRQGDPSWSFHSERQRHERSHRGEELGEMYGQTKSRWRPIDLHFAEGLFEQTRDFARRIVAEEDPQGTERLRPMLDDEVVGNERRHFLMRTADILSTTVGVTLVLVGSRA
jgi:hypothetical protein